jgi:hypothetical protein
MLGLQSLVDVISAEPEVSRVLNLLERRYGSV